MRRFTPHAIPPTTRAGRLPSSARCLGDAGCRCPAWWADTALLLIVCLAACTSKPGPEETARRFHDLASKGSWPEALALVDLDAKATRMLGDLYLNAPEEDRRATREIWARRLQAASKVYYRGHFLHSAGGFTVSLTSETDAEVVQSEGKFALVYWLRKGDDGWRITDRAHEMDGIRPSASRGMAVVLSRIERELGHEPTLAEVNRRLEYYITHVRPRTIHVNTTPGDAQQPGTGR